jgi:hypothetical protein
MFVGFVRPNAFANKQETNIEGLLEGRRADSTTSKDYMSRFFTICFRLFLKPLQLHFPPFLTSSAEPKVAESGRRLLKLLRLLRLLRPLDELREVVSVVVQEDNLSIANPSALWYDRSFDFGLVGRGSWRARKPDAKAPPYAFSTSRDAALLRATLSFCAFASPSFDSANSPS